MKLWLSSALILSAFIFSNSAFSKNIKPIVPISTCEQLQNINNSKVIYQVINDIDCKGKTLNTLPEFWGELSGVKQNHGYYEIRNFRLNANEKNQGASLFEHLSGAYIHDLKFSNITIEDNPEQCLPYYTSLSLLTTLATEHTLFENLSFDDIKIHSFCPDGTRIGMIAAQTINDSYSIKSVNFKNIDITNSIIRLFTDSSEESYDKYVGFVVGRASAKDILKKIHVSNSSFETNYSTENGRIIIGGLLGIANGPSIYDSMVSKVTFGSTEYPIFGSANHAGSLGALIGYANDNTIVRNKVQQIAFFTQEMTNVGALVGDVHGGHFKQNAISDVRVTFCNNLTSMNLGAFIGNFDESPAKIFNNYVQATFYECEKPNNKDNNIGGFIGEINSYSAATMHNNYAVVSMQNIYSRKNVNGFIGYWPNSFNADNLTGNIWDSTVAGLSQSRALNGVTSVVSDTLKNQSELESLGWDFNAIWEIKESDLYPNLIWENK